MFVFIQDCYSSKIVTFPTKNVTINGLMEAFNIAEGEDQPTLMNVTGPRSHCIGPNEDGVYENLEGNETYTCFYEEVVEEEEEVVMEMVAKSIDSKLRESIDRHLKNFHEVKKYLTDGALPTHMEGPTMKEKRHYFRRKVGLINDLMISYSGQE